MAAIVVEEFGQYSVKELSEAEALESWKGRTSRLPCVLFVDDGNMVVTKRFGSERAVRRIVTWYHGELKKERRRPWSVSLPLSPFPSSLAAYTPAKKESRRVVDARDDRTALLLVEKGGGTICRRRFRTEDDARAALKDMPRVEASVLFLEDESSVRQVVDARGPPRRVDGLKRAVERSDAAVAVLHDNHLEIVTAASDDDENDDDDLSSLAVLEKSSKTTPAVEDVVATLERASFQKYGLDVVLVPREPPATPVKVKFEQPQQHGHGDDFCPTTGGELGRRRRQRPSIRELASRYDREPRVVVAAAAAAQQQKKEFRNEDVKDDEAPDEAASEAASLSEAEEGGLDDDHRDSRGTFGTSWNSSELVVVFAKGKVAKLPSTWGPQTRFCCVTIMSSNAATEITRSPDTKTGKASSQGRNFAAGLALPSSVLESGDAKLLVSVHDAEVFFGAESSSSSSNLKIDDAAYLDSLEAYAALPLGGGGTTDVAKGSFVLDLVTEDNLPLERGYRGCTVEVAAIALPLDAATAAVLAAKKTAVVAVEERCVAASPLWGGLLPKCGGLFGGCGGEATTATPGCWHSRGSYAATSASPFLDAVPTKRLEHDASFEDLCPLAPGEKAIDRWRRGDGGSVDDQGWQYAKDLTCDAKDWHPTPDAADAVRRRCWTRRVCVVADDDLTKKKDPGVVDQAGLATALASAAAFGGTDDDDDTIFGLADADRSTLLATWRTHTEQRGETEPPRASFSTPYKRHGDSLDVPSDTPNPRDLLL